MVSFRQLAVAGLVASMLSLGCGGADPEPPTDEPAQPVTANLTPTPPGSGSVSRARAEPVTPGMNVILLSGIVAGEGPSRQAAIDELKRRGPKAIDELVTIAKGRSPTRRVSALETLVALEREGVAAFCALLEPRDVELSGEVLRVARSHAIDLPPGVVPALLALAKSKVEAVSVAAAEQLVAITATTNTSPGALETVLIGASDLVTGALRRHANGKARALVLIGKLQCEERDKLVPIALAGGTAGMSIAELVVLCRAASGKDGDQVRDALVGQLENSAGLVARTLVTPSLPVNEAARLVSVLEAMGRNAAFVVPIVLDGPRLKTPVLQRRVAWWCHALAPSDVTEALLLEALSAEAVQGTDLDLAVAARYGTLLAGFVTAIDQLPMGLYGQCNAEARAWWCAVLSEMGEVGIRAMAECFLMKEKIDYNRQVIDALRKKAPRVITLIGPELDATTVDKETASLIASMSEAGARLVIAKKDACSGDIERRHQFLIGLWDAALDDEGPLVPAWIELIDTTHVAGTRVGAMVRLMRVTTRETAALAAMKEAAARPEFAFRYAASWGLLRSARAGLHTATPDELARWSAVHEAAAAQLRDTEPQFVTYLTQAKRDP